MRVRAHAKVNLCLRVLARRDDGYHDVDTVLHGVSLADEIEVVEDRPGEVHVTARAGAPVGVLPDAEDDLVARAAGALAARSERPVGARIEVVKRIPVGAGLGGGSSDAAATLLALNDLWGLHLGRAELAEVAGRLGSDVPYFLSGATMRARGRGEVLSPMRVRGPLWFVLGLSTSPLLTQQVYARWSPRARDRDGAGLAAALASGDPAAVARVLRNDLEEAAFELRPELPEAKRALLEAGALGALVSGSGPTLFGVARDRAHAAAVAGAVAGAFDRTEIVASTTPSR
ncbi:MAG TPA: 4-(cytidine 5'-diphospho)-2-C-methyl-D-erythritol kinase [Actinomycetota bacterium]|nr:4-(cytidine 5'-diphospho)-2-C-methyl-D-erythritol kinase [Actinomycetota bacterium]